MCYFLYIVVFPRIWCIFRQNYNIFWYFWVVFSANKFAVAMVIGISMVAGDGIKILIWMVGMV